MPQSTDLVTNLPADFAIFGDAVDLDISSRGGYTSTATAAGTTTLTVTSNRNQRFTGVTTQTVVMPVASTLAAGARWVIQNKSTEIVTVNSSGGNAIIAIAAGATYEIVCILASGTTAASWDYDWTGTKTAPTTGSMTLLSTTSLSGTSTTISSIVGGYRHLYIYGKDLKVTASTAALKLTWNGFTVGTYGTIIAAGAYAAFTNTRISNAAGILDPVTGRATLDTATNTQFICNFREYTQTSGFRIVDGCIASAYSEDFLTFAALNDTNSNAITSFTITTSAGTQSLTGTIYVYGVL